MELSIFHLLPAIPVSQTVAIESKLERRAKNSAPIRRDLTRLLVYRVLARIDRGCRRVFDLVASGEGPWITYSLVSALDVGEEGEGPIPLENNRPSREKGRKMYTSLENPFFPPSLKLE